MIAKQQPKKSTNRSRRPAVMGVIERGKAYPQHIFCRLLGITRFAVRDMRKRGLKVRKDGRYSLILGDDYLDYLSQRPTSDQVLQQKHESQSTEGSPNPESPAGEDGSDD